MGDHSVAASSLWQRTRTVASWVWVNKNKLISGAIVALPIISRYVPDFPSAEIVAILRAFLGA